MNLQEELHSSWIEYDNKRSDIETKIREIVGEGFFVNIFGDDIILTCEYPINNKKINQINDLLGADCIISSIKGINNKTSIRLVYNYDENFDENQTTFEDFK